MITAVSEPLSDLAKLYTADESTVYSLLLKAIGKVYNSVFPAVLWDDGTITVVDSGSWEHRTLKVSQDKYTKIMSQLNIMLIDNFGVKYSSLFLGVANQNNGLFYGKITKVHEGHIELSLFKNLTKSNNILLDNVVAHCKLADLLGNDASRNIIKEGFTLLFSARINSIRPANGKLEVALVRNHRSVIAFSVDEAVDMINATLETPIDIRVSGIDFKKLMVAVSHVGNLSRGKRDHIITNVRRKSGFRVVFNKKTAKSK